MITYAVKKTRNPNGIEGTDYFAGRAIKTGEYSFSDLAEDINNSTTVTKADAMAVLASIKPFVTKALLSGQVVVLQDLGRLQVTLQGKCYPEEAIADKEFVPSSMIKSHKIVFRPDAALKREVAQDFKLKRISSEAMA
jgi:predicted histone-like DNA-binding protein